MQPGPGDGFCKAGIGRGAGCFLCGREARKCYNPAIVARVFLSYRHEDDLDTKIAEAIYAGLTNLNHEVFLDFKRIRPGDAWATTIEENIDRA